MTLMIKSEQEVGVFKKIRDGVLEKDQEEIKE